MGLGFGFCCCEPECVLFLDTFDRDAVGDDWAINTGTWNIVDGVLTTTSVGAQITCNREATEYPYGIQIPSPTNIGAKEWKIHFGQDVLHVKAIIIGGIRYGWYQALYHGGVLVWERPPAGDPYQTSGQYAPSPTLLVIVDRTTVSLLLWNTTNNWMGLPVKICVGSEVGKTVSLEVVDPGDVRFSLDFFQLSRSNATCYPSSQCSAWDCSGGPSYSPPNAIFADLSFTPGGPCFDDGRSGVWELPYIQQYTDTNPAYTSTYVGGRSDYLYYGFPDTSCAWFSPHYTGQTYFFRVLKLSDTLYRAQFVSMVKRLSTAHGGFETGGDARQWMAGWQKDYTSPRCVGWEDDLPLVCYGPTLVVSNDLSTLGISNGLIWGNPYCTPDETGYGNSVHVRAA